MRGKLRGVIEGLSVLVVAILIVSHVSAYDLQVEMNQLKEQLSSSDAQTRATAAYSLGFMGSQAKPVHHFLEQLANDTAEVICSANIVFMGEGSKSYAIARGRDPKKWLERKRISDIVSTSLHRIDTRDYSDCNDDVERMIKQLNDEDWDVRWHAAETLGKKGDARAIAPLTRAYEQEKDLDVKKIIGEALHKTDKDSSDRNPPPSHLATAEAEPSRGISPLPPEMMKAHREKIDRIMKEMRENKTR